MSDSELWLSFQQGNIHAFQQLYQEHHPDLYALALKTTHNPARSADCLQNLFCNLWKNRSRLAAVGAIKPYLRKALLRDLGRQARLTHNHRVSSFGIDPVAWAMVYSPEDLLVEAETRQQVQRQLWQAVHALPRRQREAVYLKFYKNLSYQEMAVDMGMHYQSVVNLLFRAMQSLKRAVHLRRLSG